MPWLWCNSGGGDGRNDHSSYYSSYDYYQKIDLVGVGLLYWRLITGAFLLTDVPAIVCKWLEIYFYFFLVYVCL